MGSKKKKKKVLGTILIVEDVYMVRRTLHLMLESAGYRVTEARESKEAMDLIKAGRIPDLIILDIAMPGVDGLDFLRVLRAYPDTGKTPIMMCTARGEENTIKLARQNGATDFMVKPVNRDTLLAKVIQIFQDHPPASLEEAVPEGEIGVAEEGIFDAPPPEKKKKKKKKKAGKKPVEE